MAVPLRRLSDRKTETLTELWQNEPVLLNSGNDSFMNAGHHRAAMQRISARMDVRHWCQQVIVYLQSQYRLASCLGLSTFYAWFA
jgi:hypothetical protein